MGQSKPGREEKNLQAEETAEQRICWETSLVSLRDRNKVSGGMVTSKGRGVGLRGGEARRG